MCLSYSRAGDQVWLSAGPPWSLPASLQIQSGMQYLCCGTIEQGCSCHASRTWEQILRSGKGAARALFGGWMYTEYAVSGRPSGVAGHGCREELRAVPKLALGLGSHAGQDTPYKESPRHAGAPPSRLPRPMSAASPRCSGSR